jgi:hypothetical protein
MAYVSQADKKELAPAIKAVLKKYDMKATIAVRNRSTLVVKVKSGAIDFTDYANPYQNGYIDVNVYWIDKHYSGVARDFLNELLDAMKGPKYFCDDDTMTDYFHRSHYTDIEIGQYNRAYVCTANELEAA